MRTTDQRGTGRSVGERLSGCRRLVSTALTVLAFWFGSRAETPAPAQDTRQPEGAQSDVRQTSADEARLKAIEKGIWDNVLNGGDATPSSVNSANSRTSQLATHSVDDVLYGTGEVDPADIDSLPFIWPPEEDMPLGWVGKEIPRPGRLDQGYLYPVEDRWRLGFPLWDRYVYGSPTDPYHSNVLKGDYPLRVGDNRFLEIEAVSDSQFVTRRRPAAVGTNDDNVFVQRFFLTTDYFIHENTFHPSEWFVRMTQALDYRDVEDVKEFVDYGIQELFLDLQIAIVSEYYDTTDVRIGRQVFVNDFRGFLYADAQKMVRLFGNYDANRWQWNVVVIDPDQVDAASGLLRTWEDRQQIIVGANFFRQDFPVLGVFVHGGAYFNRDRFQQSVDAYFFELAAEGVYNGFEFTAAFIQALGRDELNPVAGRAVDINAQFAAFEITRPMDWFIPRFSVQWASGDTNPTDSTGRGFDGIVDNPFIAGANFAFFNREAVAPGGLILSNGNSFLPNLRAKAAAPSNFVNPGIIVLTTGVDTVLSARTVAFFNFNHYQFEAPQAVEQAAGGNVDISNEIGQDVTIGVIHKPLIVDNVIITSGVSRFFQGTALDTLTGEPGANLYTAFVAATLVY